MTSKQKRAVEIMVENGGNVSQAMMAAGYSPATAKTPSKLTESTGFEEVVKQYRLSLFKKGINGEKLAKKMVEWIDAVKITSSLTEPDRVVPDYQTQIKAGEMLREDFGLIGKQAIQILNQGEMDIQFTK